MRTSLPERHPIFTPEHEELFLSMRSWVEKELYPNRLLYEESTWPDDVLRRAGDLGFLGLCFSQDWGGQGGDYYYSLVRAEALSYSGSGGLNMGLAVHTDMVLPPIDILGTEDQKERFLRPSIAGTKIGCLGITEPDAGSDVSALQTSARLSGDEWVISGSKVFITNGMRADFCLLVARTDPEAPAHEGLSLLLVPLREGGEILEGVTLSSIDKMGMHASDTAEISLNEVRIPAENLLGERGSGFKHIAWELQGERLVGAIGCVAGAERIMERTRDYLASRQAFGRPLSGFQALRHRYAQMSSELAAVRDLCYTTAWRWNQGLYPVREISQAKLLAAEVLCRIADECLQMHGGWGYTKEYEIERMYRDARLNRIGAGTDEIMREIVSKIEGL